MRKPIIAGNWKMNNDISGTKALIQALIPLVRDAACDVVACVPATSLMYAGQLLEGSNIALGAQNVHWAQKGAYTGEISADMLKGVGVSHVIIGHSERRQYFGETDETVNLRTLAAVKAGLTPIVCVGELLGQREAGYTDTLVAYQTLTALTGLSAAQVADIVIAYEPVWAIGTGKTATAEEAGRVCGVIRTAIRGQYGDAAADAVRIQYGGSMNPGNVKELMAQPEIDGGLIGGASLKAEDFTRVVLY